jgi:hypothetical protein
VFLVEHLGRFEKSLFTQFGFAQLLSQITDDDLEIVSFLAILAQLGQNELQLRLEGLAGLPKERSGC